MAVDKKFSNPHLVQYYQHLKYGGIKKLTKRLEDKVDRNRCGGGVIVYVQNDIPSKQLTKHKIPDDIDGVFIEVNLMKTKW